MEKSCTLLVHFDRGTPALVNEIKQALEGNDVEAKIDALKQAIMLLINGDTIPHLFITIIRYVLTSEDHTIQKLLLLYLEIIDKTDSRGKILPEMILICQNLRNNLQHPNEYIRGVTLRFLCRIKEVEIVEPLIPSILSNLEHRNHFVRRNAVLAVMSVYRSPNGDQLLADAPEMIERFLSTEQDHSSKRNAFLMLFNCDQDRAVRYLFNNIDRINDWGEQLQMVVLELIRKVCRSNKDEKGKYLMIIISLLNSPSTAVVYDCAGTLVSLSSAPTAIQAAANTYCQLLLSQSDNNVKLIVLDRINELRASHREIMVEMVMDVLRALTSPNHDIRRKTLDIVLDLIMPRNVDEVVSMLKKEVVKTQSGEQDKTGEYRQMLVQAIHTCAMKFPEVAGAVVHILMDFLCDTNVASAMDVVVFVREIIETNPKLRAFVITRLLDTFYQIRASRVCCCALWIIGEYCLSLSEVECGIATMKQCLGDLPFFTVSNEGESQDTSKNPQPVNTTAVSSRRPVVLADGTYATQSAVFETAISHTFVQGSLASIGNLRSLILSGDFFLGAVVACTLTKLVLRLEEVQPLKLEVNLDILSKMTTKLPLLILISECDQASIHINTSSSFEYERLISKGELDFDIRRPKDEWDPIALNYTSGTTSNPKGVIYSHRATYLNSIAAVFLNEMVPMPVYLWCVPMFHSNGWCLTWAVAAQGGTNICQRNVTAGGIFEQLSRHNVTHMGGAPTVLNMIINAPASEQRPLRNKVVVMTGAAPPPAYLIFKMEELGFKVMHAYGLTETYGPGTICAWKPEWDSLPRDSQAKIKSRQGLQNVCMEEVDVKDPVTLKSVPLDAKTIGEVMFRGNTVMCGYLKDVKATEAAFSGGWLRSGDLGVKHPDGYIELKDRAKDIIISGGENISSIEVESVLFSHPAVLEAAIVGRPDDHWGETPCAFVMLKDGGIANAEEIMSFCRNCLPHYMAPKTVVFGNLPKTSTGKVQKNVLRQKAKEMGSLSKINYVSKL